MSDTIEWESVSAPSLADIEQLGEAALTMLPPALRALCEGVLLRVDDFPDAQTLDAFDCETDFDLLGLFRGRGLAQTGASQATGEMPNMVWLYRRPILDYWSEHEETLGAIVRHVMIHEIGHHFGLSDDDIAAIEAQPD